MRQGPVQAPRQEQPEALRAELLPVELLLQVRPEVWLPEESRPAASLRVPQAA